MPDTRPVGRDYLVKSRRGVIGRLMKAAIELALIAILIAMFIMAAIFAMDLSDMW